MSLEMTKLSKEAIARQRALKVYIQRGGSLDTICDIGLFGPHCIDKPPGPEGIIRSQPPLRFGPIVNTTTPPGPSAAMPS
jgi:hypothetical protein